MENNTIMPTLNVAQKSVKQEALGQSKGYKISNWVKTKLCPFVKTAMEDVWQEAKALGRSLSKIHINWVVILALVILANMAKNGAMDDMPNLKWLLESAMRLIEWVIGLLRNLLKWVMDLPGLGIFKDWVKYIFAL